MRNLFNNVNNNTDEFLIKYDSNIRLKMTCYLRSVLQNNTEV